MFRRTEGTEVTFELPLTDEKPNNVGDTMGVLTASVKLGKTLNVTVWLPFIRDVVDGVATMELELTGVLFSDDEASTAELLIPKLDDSIVVAPRDIDGTRESLLFSRDRECALERLLSCDVIRKRDAPLTSNNVDAETFTEDVTFDGDGDRIDKLESTSVDLVMASTVVLVT